MIKIENTEPLIPMSDALIQDVVRTEVAEMKQAVESGAYQCALCDQRATRMYALVLKLDHGHAQGGFFPLCAACTADPHKQEKVRAIPLVPGRYRYRHQTGQFCLDFPASTAAGDLRMRPGHDAVVLNGDGSYAIVEPKADSSGGTPVQVYPRDSENRKTVNEHRYQPLRYVRDYPIGPPARWQFCCVTGEGRPTSFVAAGAAVHHLRTVHMDTVEQEYMLAVARLVRSVARVRHPGHATT